MMPRTMFEKIWDRHVIVEELGEALLYIDRGLLHEVSSHAFTALKQQGFRFTSASKPQGEVPAYPPPVTEEEWLAAVARPTPPSHYDLFTNNSGSASDSLPYAIPGSRRERQAAADAAAKTLSASSSLTGWASR